MQKPTIAQLALIAAGGLIAATLPSPAGAQSVNGIVLIDVMIVNDNGGTLTNPEVVFMHTNDSGQQTETTGTDNDPIKCLTSDGATCHIGLGPVGPGDVRVPAIVGYTIDTQCVAQDATSAASGATFDLAASGEVFCVITLDDIAPVTPTTSTTTTVAPTTTTAPTTVVPATAPPATPAPTTVLPETGLDDSGSLALIALALLAAGGGTMALSRRRIS